MRLQTTLGKTISVSGIGLHSGREIHATLRPAPAGRGIVFVRTDRGGTIPGDFAGGAKPEDAKAPAPKPDDSAPK